MHILLLTARRISKQQPGLSKKRDVLEWLPHDDDNCDICDRKCKGGHPKKKKSGDRPSALATHIQSAGSHIPEYDISHRVQPNSHTKSFTCDFCKSFVIRPVEIQPCKSLGCSSCCIHAVSSGQTFSCPGCLESHQCNTSVFSKLSPIVEKILNELLVTCDRCGNPVTLVAAHNKCQNHMLTERVTLEELIQVPVDKELTNLEKKAAASLVS